MWALRRTVKHLRVRGEYGNVMRRSATLLESSKCNAVPSFPSGALQGERLPQTDAYIFGKSISFVHVSRGFASRGGLKNKEEDKDKVNEEEGGFSELDLPPSTEEALASDSDSEMTEAEAQSDPYLSEADVEEATPAMLSEAVTECKTYDLPATLDKWVQGGALTREAVVSTYRHLRKRKMYQRCLQVSDWMWRKKPFKLNESDYAGRLDFIAKAQSIDRAERFFESTPVEMRGCKMYRALLGNCSREKNLKKTEEVFQKMKDAGHTLGIFEYNCLLSLYKWVDKKKIRNVLKMMEDGDIKPDSFTYMTLIDAKGLVGDIVGMEQIVETMKAEGINTDPQTVKVLATHYFHAGNTKKAEAMLEELEKNGTAKNEHYILKLLLPLYADFGKVSEVERIWNVFESFPKLFVGDCIIGIRAWGKLGKIEKAEIIFEKLLNSGMNLSGRAYSALLDVYANHGLLLKGKELVERMSANGITYNHTRLGGVVKLYVNSGDLVKANSIMLNACSQKQLKPSYRTMILILEKYAERGDIANAENIFDRLTSLGYSGRLKSYEFLLQAYIKARVPAYGFKERIVAATLYPNRRITNLLRQVDAFKKDALKKDP